MLVMHKSKGYLLFGIIFTPSAFVHSSNINVLTTQLNMLTTMCFYGLWLGILTVKCFNGTVYEFSPISQRLSKKYRCCDTHIFVSHLYFSIKSNTLCLMCSHTAII